MYCQVSDVRRYCGFTVDDVSDSDLEFYIKQATKEVIADISVAKKQEVMVGDIDGDNTKFYTQYSPIADVTGDSLVTASDVTIVAWGTLGSLDTRVTFSVSTINDYNGRVVLSSAPSDTFDAVTADYSYYLREINWDMVEIATAYLAGAMYVRKELLLIPDRFAPGGPIRFTYREKPYVELMKLYYHYLDRARRRYVAKRRMEEMKLVRREMR